jgi:hypothetical protein
MTSLRALDEPTTVTPPALAADGGTEPAARVPASDSWPLWTRVLFRFFFIYLLLQTSPWTWLAGIPGLGFIASSHYRIEDWAVRAANARLFHVREELIAVNGSGDTSWAWAQMWLYLTVAAVGAALWSVLDRKRNAHPKLDYWLRTVLRYYIATAALSYGIIKLFVLQMPFPSQSQLSTPLGDLLPMRLSWLFIGYSTTYQFFSGAMETIAGLLLLYRRTVTLGLFAATGAFLNVVMINLSYDVPVKLFAMHLLFACLFLLALDGRRLFTFLVLNRTAPGTAMYTPTYSRPWQMWASRGLKAVLIVLILILPLQRGWTQYKANATQPVLVPFRAGIYDVTQYIVNGDTIPPLLSDTLRWRDVIFDSRTAGSVNTADSLFWRRYRRGYFRYRADTVARTVAVWKTSAALDSTFLFTMRYEVPDSTRIRLWTSIRNESLHVELVRSTRHFQLTERQFHWLSEYNR